jgi:hypothetical protein
MLQLYRDGRVSIRSGLDVEDHMRGAAVSFPTTPGAAERARPHMSRRERGGQFTSLCATAGRKPAPNHPAKKSTTPVSKSYIAPAILMAPFDSISASTGLSLRILAMVISTFLRATASTNTLFFDVLSPT